MATVCLVVASVMIIKSPFDDIHRAEVLLTSCIEKSLIGFIFRTERVHRRTAFENGRVHCV